MKNKLEKMKDNNTFEKTIMMLKKSFESEITEEEYYILLYLLYDYMCDENLAIVMETLTKKSKWVIINDIAKAINMEQSAKTILAVEERLNMNGFEKWKLEEEV
ncbi:MAG: hypothetical protein IJ763_01245 [Lachnospiraceae bacterium]|nr:hypothetical protein [Lachnospiraceae bacterium]